MVNHYPKIRVHRVNLVIIKINNSLQVLVGYSILNKHSLINQAPAYLETYNQLNRHRLVWDLLVVFLVNNKLLRIHKEVYSDKIPKVA